MAEGGADPEGVDFAGLDLPRGVGGFGEVHLGREVERAGDGGWSLGRVDGFGGRGFGFVLGPG